jgi:hypothetical protein
VNEDHGGMRSSRFRQDQDAFEGVVPAPKRYFLLYKGRLSSARKRDRTPMDSIPDLFNTYGSLTPFPGLFLVSWYVICIEVSQFSSVGRGAR